MTIKKRRPADIDFVEAPNRTIGELFSGETFDAQDVTVRLVHLAPASEQGPRLPHRHLGFEETIYVLAGQGRMWAEGEWTDVEAGDTLLVPAGILHATFNTAEAPLSLLCFFPVPEGVNGRERGDEAVELE